MRQWWFALAVMPGCALAALLPTSPEAWQARAEAVRRAADRPWAPAEGRLGNLRHLQITAAGCVVRVVSGSENRVFAGTRDVIVVEESRVLDAHPDERPVPRDVVLAPDHAQACPGVGSCGTSVTPAARAPRIAGSPEVCFTVQLASAHRLLVGGDGLAVLFDRVHQPALHVAVNPGNGQRLWFEQVDMGALAIDVNAPVHVGGTGRVDFLSAGSSDRGSTIYLHEFDARHVGVSATTTNTRWSVRTGPGIEAGYYQPARAPGKIADLYPIEIDGPLEGLKVPARSVRPQPITPATRLAARTLRGEVLALAGPSPALPRSDSALPTAADAAKALPRPPDQRVADIVAGLVPPSVRITAVALWKSGGRLEGTAPDEATMRLAQQRLVASGQFIDLDLRWSPPQNGVVAFSGQMYLSCAAPGQASVCPPATDPRRPGTYTEDLIARQVRAILGSEVEVLDVRLTGDRIAVEATTRDEPTALAALDRLSQPNGLFRVSITGRGPAIDATHFPFQARLALVCRRAPRPDDICVPATQ